MIDRKIALLKTSTKQIVRVIASTKRQKIIGISVLALGLALIAGISPQYLRASDHDDGELDTKGRNLNLTDLYVFREQDQGGPAGNLVLIMNTNPRSVARQQYYFSSRARYEFNITRVSDKNATPTGTPNITLRFEFSEPNANAQQTMTLTAIRDGAALAATSLLTTPINGTPRINQVSLGSTPVSIFAGLREDPFFFDVEQFFRVRAGALRIGPVVGFRPPATAVDFTKGYNVNAIAVRVPISYLQGSTNTTTFDVWQTISVPGANGQFTQFERLARPAVNEGLLVTNALLNTLNMIGPDFEAAALAGQQPAASAAAPIVTEATRTLKALGNNDARTNALIRAFLPDVMRIDTTQVSNYGETIPATCLNTNGSPICGRKLTDDVIDLTLSVLTNGAVTSDNVEYTGVAGNPAQGHTPLVSSFPYLAPAN